MVARLRSQLKPSLWQSLALVAGVTVAYGLDYLFNLVVGRMLTPVEFSIVVALAGVGQVLVVSSRVIQTVVTRYISRFQAGDEADGRIASFFQSMFRASWRWGSLAWLILIFLSWPLAAFLQIEEIGPVQALAAATLLMVVRPVVGGALQGLQQFSALSAVQITQALLRLLLGALLVWLGWGAFGAMLSLPLASAIALIVGWTLLDTAVKQKTAVHHQVQLPEMFRYSTYTAAGLIGYALLINMDAILVRRLFDPDIAGNYSAAITLGKVIQFFPVAIIMILFPKAARRQAAQQDAGKILLLAMGIVGLVCGGIALVYGLFPEPIVRLVLGNEYQVEGLVLGLVGLAMLLLSLSNVWLNYFLSTEWTTYVYLIGLGILLQLGAMIVFHDALWQMPAAMVVTGLWLNLAGLIIFFWRRRA
ncbi:oligosaccharide flippase family protein [Candidatus Leptofilum sp.]|uniref:oligosaccharide flippase family protein n=1 Tax=Candidatus Leptofilum sp. TaxID=3241576 RepID=UPI003B58E4D8